MANLRVIRCCGRNTRAFADVHQILSFANDGNWRNERDELESFNRGMVLTRSTWSICLSRRPSPKFVSERARPEE